MPPSAIFLSFKNVSCHRLVITTGIALSSVKFAKLRTKGQPPNSIWFATIYPGEGKRKLAASVVIRRVHAKGPYAVSMYWFLTDEGPPPGFIPFEKFISTLTEVFGEREVDVRAEFTYDRSEVVSLFKPFDLGEQTQILDEIIGFTGIKRDTNGKILYTLEVNISDKFFTQKLMFRQTVRLDENMPIALVETASKISALATKPKEIA